LSEMLSREPLTAPGLLPHKPVRATADSSWRRTGVNERGSMISHFILPSNCYICYITLHCEVKEETGVILASK
jgi:hypothetical protein